MSTSKKQDVWCWDFTKSLRIDLTPRSRNVFIVCAVCRRAPSSETHSSETPMKGLFNCVTDLFSFFLSSYHWACGVRGNIRAVFPVVSSVRPDPQACVCTSYQKQHTVMNPHIHTHSLALPFKTIYAFHLFLSVDQTETAFWKAVWSQAWETELGKQQKNVDSFGFLCANRLFCPGLFAI